MRERIYLSLAQMGGGELDVVGIDVVQDGAAADSEGFDQLFAFFRVELGRQRVGCRNGLE